MRQLSSCITEKIKKKNGFNIISVECSRKLRKKIQTLEDPKKQIDRNFSDDISKAY